jgi:hypothetical protein
MIGVLYSLGEHCRFVSVEMCGNSELFVYRIFSIGYPCSAAILTPMAKLLSPKTWFCPMHDYGFVNPAFSVELMAMVKANCQIILQFAVWYANDVCEKSLAGRLGHFGIYPSYFIQEHCWVNQKSPDQTWSICSLGLLNMPVLWGTKSSQLLVLFLNFVICWRW